MYHHRLKIFILFSILTMSVCLVRLWYLQTAQVDQSRQQISRLRILPSKQLPTLRGKIIDRNENIVARDEPFFYLQLNYQLTRLLDPRFWQAEIQRKTASGQSPQDAEDELVETYAEETATVKKALDFCVYTAGAGRDEVEQTIAAINDRIWELGRFIFWRRNNPGTPTSEYAKVKDDIPAAKIVSVDLDVMHRSYPILELYDRPTLMAAQIELTGSNGIIIRSEPKRVYPFNDVAPQIIGWVGPVQQQEADTLFSDDAYLRYLDGEVSGKFGIEKLCEALLRGRRGEVTYDREKNEISRTEAQFGQDVQLTLDMMLQRNIQTLLSDPNTIIPGFGGTGDTAAVVLDAATGDVLAIVSLPTFDLNQARGDYNTLLKDSRRPLINRALEENYPPGSSVKPLILLAGLEEHKITADEVISCSFTLPPTSWPKCLLQWRKQYCHDARWAEEGQVNNGRNAIRGSCNVYFSQLANRLDGGDLQRWLWLFGWGTNVLAPCVSQETLSRLSIDDDLSVSFRQSPGSIIEGIQKQPFADIANAEKIKPNEKRWWGIGQGNLRATVLQVANAYAVLARRGVYKPARLIIDPNDPMNEKPSRRLPIHPANLDVVYDGMHAVVNERGGSAYDAFESSGLTSRGMTIYGKTGSTERPYHAWFASFVTDQAGRAIALAVIVEGGQSGGKDAAPLGREIIRLCNEAGFIGHKIKD
jgi:penicillin-binding protein 2